MISGSTSTTPRPSIASPSRSVSSPRERPRRRVVEGRYILEIVEIVDLLVARVVPTVDGIDVSFDDVWSRRRTIALTPDVRVALPDLDDLILTKRFAARPKGLEDVRLLEVLRSERGKQRE